MRVHRSLFRGYEHDADLLADLIDEDEVTLFAVSSPTNLRIAGHHAGCRLWLLVVISQPARPQVRGQLLSHDNDAHAPDFTSSTQCQEPAHRIRLIQDQVIVSTPSLRRTASPVSAQRLRRLRSCRLLVPRNDVHDVVVLPDDSGRRFQSRAIRNTTATRNIIVECGHTGRHVSYHSDDFAAME